MPRRRHPICCTLLKQRSGNWHSGRLVMIINELDRQACLSILSESRVGRLAMSDGEHPYVVPMSFAMEDEALFGFTLPGRKLDTMRANPRVAMLVERNHEDGTWQSVLAEGRFT